MMSPTVALLLLAVPTLAATNGAVNPALKIEPDQVSASGITPGGQAVLLYVAHERPKMYLRFVRREILLVDEDRDGTVAWRQDQPPSKHSVVAVVDLTTGAFAVQPHPDGPDRPRPFPDEVALAMREPVRDFKSRSTYVAMLVVRPGVGAWLRTCADGDPSDAEGDTAGSLTVRVGSLAPLATSPTAPDQLQLGDVVIGIDLNSLEYVAARMGEKR